MRPGLLFLFLLSSFLCNAQLHIEKCNDDLTVEKLITGHFIRSGITITNIKKRIHPLAIGLFSDHDSLTGMLEGIIMSTGCVDSLHGPNKRVGTTSLFRNFDNYADEDFKTAHHNYDAMALIIDFIPTFDSICFEYCFGSEEYPEFVGSEFNDLFVLYLKQKGMSGIRSLARLPNGQPVSINGINQRRNKDYFIDNSAFHHFDKKLGWQPLNAERFKQLEYDGFTSVLTAGAFVTAGKEHQLKIIITDLNDANFDSGVFLKSRSFRSIPAAHAFARTPRRKFIFHFDIASYALKETDSLSLPDITRYITDNHIDSVFLTGHTDSTGNEEKNMSLSLSRAESVKRNLVQMGVPASIITTRGKASQWPIASNQTVYGRTTNRRVDVILLKVPVKK